MRWRAFTRLSATLPAALLLLASPSASAGASFSPCPADPTMTCASVPVPLDRAGAVPGTIALSVERRTAAGAPSRSAVVALAGGPGQAVLPLAKFIAESVSPALAGRDLLLFDQRGTGTSGPLSCPALSGNEAAPAQSVTEAVQRCASQLGAARGDYTTSESVEDIEAVRRAGGYQKLVLYGTSYGTKVALEYAQRYPQNVESMVLDSTEIPEGPEPFHVATFQAIGPALAELCSQRACAHSGGNPLADLARLVAAAHTHPLTGYAYDGRGRRVKHSIGGFTLLGLLIGSDLNPAERALLPAALHAAVRRDLAPLARLVALAGARPAREEPNGEIDGTLYLTTSCEETPFPWRRGASEAIRIVEAEAAVLAVPTRAFYPFNAETALVFPPLTACVSWPDASPAPRAGGPVPNVPTLILSGGQDLRTPTGDAQRVAAMIPDAQLVKVPYTGHSVLGSDFSGCAHAALVAFFAGAPVAPCGAVQNRFPPPPVPPQALASVRPLAGTGGSSGRTLAAALASVHDLGRSVIDLALGFGALPVGTGFGGLRGGSAQMTSAGARLEHYSYVPGVTLSGLVPTGILLKDEGAAAHLQIGGSAAVSGRLTLATGGRLSAQLGGHRLSARVAAKAGRAQASPPAAFPSPLARQQ
jgi:pimeloyl-ACP methyl ester carboxylesterase